MFAPRVTLFVQRIVSICGFTEMRFTGICHGTAVKGLKCTVVCYFQGRIFNPTNLLNYVALCIELMMHMLAIY